MATTTKPITFAELVVEARGLDCVISIDDDPEDGSITLRPEGGDDCSGDATIDAHLRGWEEGNGDWPFFGTLSEYLAERARTNNWT